MKRSVEFVHLVAGESMAKRVFFSFHYQDVVDFRANVVRNHWLTKPDRESAGFFDASVWETAKKTSKLAVKKLINGGLEGTSVTCVLAGTETYSRPWVRYELLKSINRGNPVFAVQINSIAGKDERTKTEGPNPLDYLAVRYDSAGTTATYLEHVSGSWREYEEIAGTANHQTPLVPIQFRGKAMKLSEFCPIYNWRAHDGYNNFANWIKLL